MLARNRILLALAVVLAAPVALPAYAASGTVPDGYRTVEVDRLMPGVQHVVLERTGPDVEVNVAQIGRKANVDLRSVSSFGRIAGDGPLLERTSSMCARVDCLVAINGDFFRDQIAVGAVAADGELLRSPNPKHHQLLVEPDGSLRAGQLDWSARLVATDLSELSFDGLNVERGRNDLVLYTPAYGPRTGTNDHGVEMKVRFVAPRTGRVPIGQTAVVRVRSYEHGSGDRRIPRDGAVLSAHGKAAQRLGALWERIRAGAAGREALLRIETTPTVQTAIGGTPVLLRDGATWFGDAPNAFVRSRHPRTIVGWNKAGDAWLVTVDGRQPGHSVGFSLAEAASFMRGLGATDAINLDGGGSTTFVVRGSVVSRPSDRAVVSDGRTVISQTVASGVRAANVERPVANALVVVPASGSDRPLPLPDLVDAVPHVQTLSAPVDGAADPGSNPEAASLPALVGAVPDLPAGRGVPFAAAGALNALVAAVLVRRLWRPRRAA